MTPVCSARCSVYRTRSVPFCSANSAHIHYPKVLLPTAFSPYFHITVVRLRQAGWHIQCSVCTFVWEFPVGLVPTGTPQSKVYEPAGYSGLHRDANGVKTAWKPKSQEPSEELAEETEEKKNNKKRLSCKNRIRLRDRKPFANHELQLRAELFNYTFTLGQKLRPRTGAGTDGFWFSLFIRLCFVVVVSAGHGGYGIFLKVFFLNFFFELLTWLWLLCLI